MNATTLTKAALNHALCLWLLAGLAACSSSPQGVRIVNGGTSAIPSKVATPIHDLTPDQIAPAVVGKTFQYTRKGASGFVIYNADGSLTITDDQKGQTTGRWMASGGQYCESFGASAPMECGVFKDTGDAFFAANTRLVEMKI
ncbi:hypothetical protein [Aestuariivirga litoralis]|uniref:hypothetical protein n=1 Tax=Aestuariivirga litoralis TaxID=2650924 RepID=UPI0018C71194|nr:hypothetical protein [Aestuariivirga litoralis]MBG1231020.1 hypothetical protein [Aestuariivirga litoralis]